MNDRLTPAQIASYRENGFVKVEGFLSPDELQTWREVLDECLGRRGATRILGHDSAQTGEGYYDQVFIQRVNLWQDNARMKELILDERIGKMACDLEGIDGIRVWHDQTLIKAPWANPTSWHLDVPYWSFSSRHAISLWVALDDATYENGCLYFIPGAYKTATFENATIGPDMGALFKIYPQWSKMKPVAVPMKAGDCSFHNGLTPHGAGANMTPGYRRAMTCGFMPDGSTFNGRQNILTKEQLAKLKVGDLLNDDEKNPLVYSTQRQAVGA